MTTLSEQLQEADNRVWRNVYEKIKALHADRLVMVRRTMTQSEAVERFGDSKDESPMTNPTLERAARAAAIACEQVRPSDEHDAEAWTFIARAALMAVLPTEKDADDAPEWMDPAQAYGWGCGFNACRQAILNDGEGE